MDNTKWILNRMVANSREPGDQHLAKALLTVLERVEALEARAEEAKATQYEAITERIQRRAKKNSG